MKTTIKMYKDQVAGFSETWRSLTAPTSRLPKSPFDQWWTPPNLAPNRVLGTLPPGINPEIMTMDRTTWSELSQLWNGFSKLLNSYLHRLDEDIPDEWQDGSSSQHDTAHLFACRANPTDLKPASLWSSPFEAGNFLTLEFELDFCLSFPSVSVCVYTPGR